MQQKIILASKSASRKTLLSGAGITFEAISADINERQIEEPLLAAGAKPPQVALALAKSKAEWVSERFPEAFVIGSDQTLSLNERVFHKPKDMAEAATHIRAFSAKTHHLNCGVAIARNGKTEWSDISIATMTMRSISEDFLAHYLAMAGEEILQSVGAYQFEGLGIQLFDKIEGDYFTILGLPMLTLLGGLRYLGAIDG